MPIVGLLATSVALAVIPPAVPANLQVENAKAFLIAHASGTQNYICLPSATGVAWTLFGPQATLFDEDQRQIITHFLSANPGENGTLRPTWQHSRDTSAVWGAVLKMSSDANYVAPDAIPWLLLEATVVADGPDGGDKLTATRRIQRLNTVEGKAPATGCSIPDNIGKRALVPYEADYYFYKKKGRLADED